MDTNLKNNVRDQINKGNKLIIPNDVLTIPPKFRHFMEAGYMFIDYFILLSYKNNLFKNTFFIALFLGLSIYIITSS